MPVISVINYKGGVGKTTVTANLAAELAWRGRRVLLIDLDSQASLTFSFVKPDYWQEDLEADGTIKSWFDSFEAGRPMSLENLVFEPEDVKMRLRDARRSGEIHLIASHLGLINVDLDLATELGGGTMSKVKAAFLRVHRRLLDGLSTLVDQFDLVLIDCPPNFNVVTKTAIVASDHLLIPAKPDYLSTLGIDYLKRSLDQLVEDFNEFATSGRGTNDEAIDPEIMGVVFTMVQVRSGKPIAALRPFIAQVANLDMPVFDQWMRENKTLFADAPEYGVPVVIGSRPSGQTYETVVQEIEHFVTEFEKSLWP